MTAPRRIGGLNELSRYFRAQGSHSELSTRSPQAVIASSPEAGGALVNALLEGAYGKATRVFAPLAAPRRHLPGFSSVLAPANSDTCARFDRLRLACANNVLGERSK